jgi:coenzyme F420 hydrogenase subunit beta
MPKDIQWVAENGLCTGCGLCTSVCSEKCISLRETAGGLLQAAIEHRRCIDCGMCLKVCGGYHLDSSALAESVDPFVGTCRSIYLAKATDEELLQNGQSGGAVMALAQFLLESGQATAVISTHMSDDGSLRPTPRLFRDATLLRESQGSHYVPVPLGMLFSKEWQPNKDRIVVIGLGCHFHSIYNASRLIFPQWSECVVAKIGLFCDRALSFAVYQHLADSIGVPFDKVMTYRFRSKKWNGWPGDGRLVDRDGTEHCVPNRNRLECKDAFTPLHCRLCFDKANILSDITAGDPWSLTADPRGKTLLIARNEKGERIIRHASEHGTLALEDISLERVLGSQHFDMKRATWSAYTQMHKDNGCEVPAFAINQRWLAKTKTRHIVSLRRNYDRALQLERAATRAEATESARPFIIQDRRNQRWLRLKSDWSPYAVFTKMACRLRGLARYIMKVLGL